ncbi:SPX domain-containing protein [Spinellus fusiger]|nr:SPX domain-containing protein [Spinellus fusiger]
MKFTKQLEAESEEIPSAWRPYLIHYRDLKRILAKVTDEIEDRGLSVSFLRESLCKDTLKVPLEQHPMAPKISYFLAGVSPKVQPCIQITYNSKAPGVQKILDTLKDTSPAPDTFVQPVDRRSIISVRSDLEYKGTLDNTDFFSLSQRDSSTGVQHNECVLDDQAKTTALLIKALVSLTMDEKNNYSISQQNAHESTNRDSSDSDMSNAPVDPNAFMKTLVIELEYDHEFFYKLVVGLQQTEKLQEEASEKFKSDIDGLESQLVRAVSSKREDDMYAWRAILGVYMDAQVFKGRIESDRSIRSVQKSRQQMAWFLNQLQTLRLMHHLKSKSTKLIFDQFIGINTALMTMKHYQALNYTAVTKILKKHDKQSGLNATKNFHDTVNVKQYFSQKMADMLCALITERFITIIPQPDDYSCPVCMNIAWRPIRLICGHVFCVRCLVKQQRKRMDSCPLCRHSDAVKLASAANLDKSLQNFLSLHFPREIKQKKKENEREQAIQDIEAITGRTYSEDQLLRMQRSSDSKCSIM